MDSARALIARGWGVSLVSRCLRVSRAQLHVILRRTDDWMDGRRSRHTDDTDVLLRIHHVIGELPTYGYRRVWALLRRQAELDGMPAINAKRVYWIMLNRPGFPGECFICELRLPDHRFRWKHNKLFLLLPEEYGPAFPAIVDCYTSPPT
ncbi:insertion element IS2 transposase InsD [Escherichia coli MS 85-1]|uniref:Insertion element IS2 transposase InsD n=2 Tax=Escherichia coli TaxID=562 RepID=A0AAN3M3J2_ECOLX|nr:insertion element IS2 transposase InsD [Escherichia coli MS 85-1]